MLKENNMVITKSPQNGWVIVLDSDCYRIWDGPKSPERYFGFCEVCKKHIVEDEIGICKKENWEACNQLYKYGVEL